MSNPTIVVATNDKETLTRDLLSSPTAVGSVILKEGFHSAGLAYNAGIDESEASDDVMVFVHQDVYLPSGWEQRLAASIRWLDDNDANWGVIGVWGVRADGVFFGNVWCSGSNVEYSNRWSDPIEVDSVDEIVIVLRRSSGLRFDPRLPGYHLYARDLCQQASKRGLKTFVIDAPVVHNSRPNPQVFDRAFFRAYRYMVRKWRADLPLRTATVPVTATGMPLLKAWARNWIHILRGQTSGGKRLSSPRDKAIQLGYE